MRPGFCAAIVLTIPPFPYDRKAVDEPVGLPVVFDGQLTATELDHLYYGEVGLLDGQLITSGEYGWTMVATATASTIETARNKATVLAEKIVVPNVRYRRDIGSDLVAQDFAFIERLKLLEPINFADI